eukprot:Nk52_evm37s215 gene=Nk52_evmTU37s215
MGIKGVLALALGVALASLAVVQVAGVPDGQAVYAVNAGGPTLVGSDGIKYLADTTPSEERGEVSQYGKQATVSGADPKDMLLYQTERYHTKTFSYTIPIREDGLYALVMKFNEVYFDAPGRKVFEVRLNGQTIRDEVDIYKEVGKNRALDLINEFEVKNNKLVIDGREFPFTGKLELSFVKLPNADNPKICAIAVVKGGSSFVNSFAAKIEDYEDEEEEDIVELDDIADLKKLNSASRGNDPYSYDLQSMAPLLITFGLFFISVYSLTKITGDSNNKKAKTPRKVGK